MTQRARASTMFDDHANNMTSNYHIISVLGDNCGREGLQWECAEIIWAFQPLDAATFGCNKVVKDSMCRRLL